MKPLSIAVGSLLIVSLLPIVGCSPSEDTPAPQGRPSGAGGPGGARGGGAPARLDAVRIQAVPFVETVVATGTLRAEESLELQTEVNGKISRILFHDGVPVAQGDLLVKIDDSTLQASLRRALARREIAALRERRLAEIVNQGAVSQLDFDQAQAEVRVLDAETDLIRAEINRTEIRAPFDGVPGVRFVSEGAYVNPNTRIATFQGLSRVKLDFSVPERYAAVIKVGDRVTFEVSGSSRKYEAEILAVEPRVDVATRSVLVRAVCENPDGALVPGTFARVEVTVQQKPSAILVPAISVISGLEERHVFRAVDGVASRVRVTTGARTSSEVEILSGLKEGDIVLISGTQQLRNGAPVIPVLPGGESPPVSAGSPGTGRGNAGAASGANGGSPAPAGTSGRASGAPGNGAR